MMKLAKAHTANEAEAIRLCRMVAAAGTITSRQRLMLCSIAVYLGVEGQRRPRIPLATLAGHTRSCERVTRRTVDELEAMGLLRVWRVIEGHQCRPRPVAYEIRVSALAALRRPDAAP